MARFIRYRRKAYAINKQRRNEEARSNNNPPPEATPKSRFGDAHYETPAGPIPHWLDHIYKAIPPPTREMSIYEAVSPYFPANIERKRKEMERTLTAPRKRGKPIRLDL